MIEIGIAQEETDLTQQDKLAVIVANSGLEQTKGRAILEKFRNFFDIADEWEKKARVLTVSSPAQIAEMKMAREGRLFLKSKRVEVENMRKQLKEQSLREGKTIDSIANILKGLMEPTEKYLDEQEHYIELQEAKRKEELRVSRLALLIPLEVDTSCYDLANMPETQFASLKASFEKARFDRLAEEARLRKEAELREAERLRLQKENEQLYKEVELQETETRKKELEAAAELKAEREANERIQREADAKLRAAQAEQERTAQALKAKEREEIDKKKQIEAAQRKAARAPDKQKVLTVADLLEEFELPSVASDEAKAVMTDIREMLNRSVRIIREKAVYL